VHAGVATPVVEGERVYAIGWNGLRYHSFQLPQAESSGDQKIATPVFFESKASKLKIPDGDVASPLVHEGLLYIATTMGAWQVFDAKTLELMYEKSLSDLRLREDGSRFKPGICASPAVAGGKIFLFDNSGIGLVLQPGREYKALARNVIENMQPTWQGKDWMMQQEQFVVSPLFVGNRMYLRGLDYLYCIGEEEAK
jgi:hypothetical protein